MNDTIKADGTAAKHPPNSEPSMPDEAYVFKGPDCARHGEAHPRRRLRGSDGPFECVGCALEEPKLTAVPETPAVVQSPPTVSGPSAAPVGGDALFEVECTHSERSSFTVGKRYAVLERYTFGLLGERYTIVNDKGVRQGVSPRHFKVVAKQDTVSLPPGWQLDRGSRGSCCYVYGADTSVPAGAHPVVHFSSGKWWWQNPKGKPFSGAAPSMLEAMCCAVGFDGEPSLVAEYGWQMDGVPGWHDSAGDCARRALELFHAKRSTPATPTPFAEQAKVIAEERVNLPAHHTVPSLAPEPADPAVTGGGACALPSGWRGRSYTCAFDYETTDARIATVARREPQDGLWNWFRNGYIEHGTAPTMLQAMCAALGLKVCQHNGLEYRKHAVQYTAGRDGTSWTGDQDQPLDDVCFAALEHFDKVVSKRAAEPTKTPGETWKELAAMRDAIPQERRDLSQSACKESTSSEATSSTSVGADGVDAFDFARVHTACVRALEHFGVGHNAKKLEEETHELGVAMAHFPDGKATAAEVITELCDVALCCYMQALSLGMDEARAELMRKAIRMEGRIGTSPKLAGSFEQRLIDRNRVLEQRLREIEGVAKGGAA